MKNEVVLSLSFASYFATSNHHRASLLR